ncbi:MAG: dephospho-CoA kinase [Ignavibacteria bacterium]|nr:dephospho-CoA kinase [Ignavibacteria bacterium]
MNKSNQIFVIGITGGIGSGKSTVAGLIAKRGYLVISTDELAKEVMLNDSEVKLKLESCFGKKIYSDDGKLNPGELSQLVFNPDDVKFSALNKLNAIVHPKVIDAMTEVIESKEQSGERIIFVESALIYEAEIDEGFDCIIVVDSLVKNCIQRTIARSGLTKDEVLLRMKSQISLEEKRLAADFVIENNSTMEDLSGSVDFILNIILEMYK